MVTMYRPIPTKSTAVTDTVCAKNNITVRRKQIMYIHMVPQPYETPKE